MSETTHDAGFAVGTAPSSPDGGLTPAELAAKYGLSVSGARPSLAAYVRQLWGRRHFILAFSSAKLTAQYSQAKLGQIWQVATPLLRGRRAWREFDDQRDADPGRSNHPRSGEP